jgi:hypothetical protein
MVTTPNSVLIVTDGMSGQHSFFQTDGVKDNSSNGTEDNSSNGTQFTIKTKEESETNL